MGSYYIVNFQVKKLPSEKIFDIRGIKKYFYN